MKLSLFGLALAATLALGATLPTPAAPATVVEIETAQHTAVIEYQDGDDLWRRATVSIRLRDGARTPWRGRLQEIRFDGLRDAPPDIARRTRMTKFTLNEELLAVAEMVVPAPENLKRIWFRGERGSFATVRVNTRHHNPSTYGDDDDDSDTPPKEPADPDDPEPDEDEIPGDDDDCGPVPAGCEVYNPWTCECDIGLEDPWGDEARTQGSTTSFGF